jgi:hypothetical protein
MKCRFTCLLLTILSVAYPFVSFSGPLDTLEPGHWYEVPESQMREVAPQEPYDPRVKNVMAAWSGGAFDTTRNSLIVWGGGHGDYWGNEVYTFSVDTLTWTRLNDPYWPAINLTQTHAWFPENNSPGSRHTYDGLAYVPDLDLFWAVGGSLWKSGSGTQQTVTLDMGTLRWSEKSRAPIVNSIGVASGYDPVTKKIYVYDNGKFVSYDPVIDDWDTLSQNAGINGLVGEVDPVNRKFVAIGKTQAWIYDLDAGTKTRSPLGAVGNNAMEQKAPGLAFDPNSNKIVAWNGGVYVYTLDLSVSPPQWTRISPAAGNTVTPTSGADRGTYGRWQYVPAKGVFIAVNRINENVYFYKLGDDTGTGGNPNPSLPEVTLNAIPTAIETGGNVTLTWSTVVADSCEAGGSPLWSGAKAVLNPNGDTVGPLTANTTFTLTCRNSGGSSSRSVTVEVVTVDTQAPEIINVTTGVDGQTVEIVFSEALEQSSAENINNYNINNNVTINSAVLDRDLRTVSLSTSVITENTDYTLSVQNLLDRATVPNRIADNSQFSFTYTAPQNDNSNSLTPAEYQWDVLQQNKAVYIDRDYTFTNIPAALEGLDYIKTANDHKSETGNPFISFTVESDVTVYIAYDMRNNPLPDWLSSWTDAGMQLETTANAPLQLYKNNFTAGTVELGANERGNSMYIVIVDQQNNNTQPPPDGNNPGPGETDGNPTDTQPNTEDTPDTESGGILGIAELIMLLLVLLISRTYIPLMRGR